MTRQRLFRIILISFLAALGLTGALHTHSQQTSQKQIEEATPVEEGVMSDKQRAHSKLYKAYQANPKLKELIRRQPANDGELLVTITPGSGELSLTGRVISITESLNTLAGSADTVIVGKVTRKDSQITEEGTFAFTDYQLIVQEVLKDTSDKIQPEESIVVTRPGGRVLLEGHVITARDRRFAPMFVEGRYLLFLNRIATTGAYQIVNDNGAFELTSQQKVEPLLQTADSLRIQQDATSFLREVRTAIAVTFSNKPGGLNE